MKLLLFFICAAFLQVSASVSLAQKITSKENNASLEKVFDDINKQTGFIFFYEDNILNGTNKVSFNVKNTTIQDVLNLCFKDQPLTYTIAGNTIGVKRKQAVAPLIPASNLSLLLAQVKVSGEIIDSATNNKVETGVVHIALNTDGDIKKLQDIAVDPDGRFRFSVAAPNSIILNVFCLGYKVKTLIFNVKADTLLKIKLTPVIHNLEEVKITQNSQLRLIPGGLSIEPDTRNFSSATLLNTYLNYVPGLDLSPQGNISFLGRPLEVYVDGRKLSISGPDLVAYLQGFNVRDLGKIDILTEPGASFDAASKAIINLNIKKFNTAGVQDVVSMGLTTPKMYYLSNSIVYATPKLRLSANVIGNHSNFSEKSLYVISSPDYPALNASQVINSQNPQDNLNMRVGLDGKLSEKVQVGFNLFTSFVRKNAAYEYQIVNASGTNNIPSNSDYNSTRYNESAYFKVDMKKGSFQTDFSNVYYKMNSGIVNQLASYNSFNNNISTNNNYYINARQTWKFSTKISSEAGVKYAYNGLENTFQTINTANLKTQTTYNEKILAGYVQSSYNTKKFGLQLGLRAEKTISDLLPQGTQNFDGRISYLNWFPNVVVSFPHIAGLSANVSYNSRISRPDYYNYLPSSDNINANSITYDVGNLALLPSVSNSIGVNLQKIFDKDKSSIILSVSKSYINNPYQSIPFVVSSDIINTFVNLPTDPTQPKTYNTIIDVPANMKQMQVYNAQLIFNKQWDLLSLNVSPGFRLYYQQNEVIKPIVGPDFLYGLNGQYSYYINTSVNFKSFKGYNLVAALFYGSKQYSALGYNNAAYGSSHVSINKGFFKDRLSTSLRIDDPFNWSKSDSYEYFNRVSIYHEYRPLIRMAYLSLSYRIGGLKATVKRYDYQDDSRLKQDVK